MQVAQSARPKTWRMTTEAYDRLVESGELEGHRVELIEGRIIQMPPQTEPHGVAMMLARRTLEVAFGAGYTVRPQLPLSLGLHSKPEPDVAVVEGSERDTLKGGTPTAAILVVEVSLATLQFDRSRKLALYARSGVRDYWIINLLDRQLEVYRRPVRAPDDKPRFTYKEKKVLKSKDSISPLAAPDALVRVRDLLP